MKLPRDLSGAELAKSLAVLGYRVTRQTGSHLRLTTAEHGEHHVSVPVHKVLPLGTLRSILREVARHAGLTPEEIVRRLFG
jgi:predicted RNA binding protein YcfA (HicA-like mRNA interferase family)